MAFRSVRTPWPLVALVGVLAASLTVRPSARVAQTAPTTAYTVVGLDARHLLPFRVSGTTDLVPLDQLTTLFGLTTTEDRLTGSVTVTAKGQRIVLTSGQSLASMGGKLVSLSGSVTRDRGTWLVPVDLLSRLIGPALGLHIDVRRASHLVAVGTASVTAVTTHIERVGAAARVTVETDAAVTHRVNRDGSRIVVQFDASAIDASAVTGSAPDFVANTHVDGSTLVIDLGPSTQTVRTATDGGRLTLDLSPAPSAAAPSSLANAPPARLPPAQIVAPDLLAASGIRTVVIDPGHGGDDAGVRGPGGTLEKDVTLQLARRVKAAIESRLGIRVILTRENDETVPTDKRTAFSNNARGDLFISLHANASLRAGAHGAEVFTLDLDEYRTRGAAIGAGEAVPVVGGGTRIIQTVPWELAQLPFATRSQSVAATAVRHLSAQNVPLFTRASDTAPLVGLAGINMPAILIEVGFLSNPDDEKALTGSDLPNALVEAIAGMVNEVRNGATSTPAPDRR